jgi:hypothetical protein
MHTIATSGHASAGVQSSIVGHSALADISIAGEGHNFPLVTGPSADASGDCDGLCSPSHSMAALACVLALLVGILVVGATRRVSVQTFLQPISNPVIGAFGRSLARSLPPPDLHILSISRV